MVTSELELLGVGNFGSGVPSYKLDVKGSIRSTSQLVSTVATGTAPVSVNSTTECPNLNAARLQGYTALNLPYLGTTNNVWLNDAGGQPRFYFAANSHTYFRTGDDFIWRSDNIKIPFRIIINCDFVPLNSL